MSELIVGIDLGTTNCCSCIYLNDKLKILESAEGGRTTPSYVFLTENNKLIVGQFAKRMADAKPEYGIYEIKRLIGRSYDDPHVKNNLNYLPFSVRNIENEPVISVEQKDRIIKKSPQELCTSILQKIKRDIEEKLGQKTTKAVITVPAYFNIAQREATLEAAKTAGFQVLKLLNEPTAAALSYYYENKHITNEGYSLVYDLGGGTFDVAILNKCKGQIDIVGVDGDTHLGGHDLDNALVEHVCKILMEEFSYNPKNERRNMRRLHNECEEAKKILSVSDDVIITLNGFISNVENLEIIITREQFELLCAPLFQKTIDIINRCLEKANLKKDDIQEVILCGGSSRIPKIQTLISQYFNGKILNKFINPDECVAEGAAIQAAMFSKNTSQAIKQITITDVTALSLGINNFVDVMTFLIKRNTPIPASSSTNRITVYNNQTNMTFDIFEGERLDSKKNYYLGKLEITGLTPAPPGQCFVEVTMSIDQSGILTVSGHETVHNVTQEIKIAYTRGSRSDSEISKAVVDASENEAEDELFRKFTDIKGYAIKYAIRVMYNLDEKNLEGKYSTIYDKCYSASNDLKNLEIENADKVISLKNELVKLCDPIVRKYSFSNMP